MLWYDVALSKKVFLNENMKRKKWVVWFYGISNIVGYLMPNSVFKHVLDIWFVKHIL